MRHSEGWYASTTAGGTLSSAFDGSTCNDIYCHGPTLTVGAGPNTTPTWTTVDGTEAACGSCHAVPPPFPHPTVAATECGDCHPFIGTVQARWQSGEGDGDGADGPLPAVAELVTRHEGVARLLYLPPEVRRRWTQLLTTDPTADLAESILRVFDPASTFAPPTLAAPIPDGTP